jgi:cell wall-associated NlpC family hydrolase
MIFSLPIIVIIFLFSTFAFSAEVTTYLVADKPIPVFNSPVAASSREAVKPDKCGQVRSLEFVALTGTQFTVIKPLGDVKNPHFEVSTSDYKTPQGITLHISGHGLSRSEVKQAERHPAVPERQNISRRLKSAIGTPYIWGANLRQGVKLVNESSAYAGLDCSGLLYEVTDGYTPRNTADLVYFGKPVNIAGNSRDQIIAKLKPLDLIVWKGHLIIVLDKEQTIESVLWCGKPGNGGVTTYPLRHRLGEIMTRRKPVDIWPEGGGKPQAFVVRRWLE